MGDVSESNQMSIHQSVISIKLFILMKFALQTASRGRHRQYDGDDEPEYTDNNVIPADAIFIEDGRRDEFLLPFGDKKSPLPMGMKPHS